MKSAFNNIIDAYLLFDVDASGDLSREEVLHQLSAWWKELGWDGDGTIIFREFIWAFQMWMNADVEEK